MAWVFVGAQYFAAQKLGKSPIKALALALAGVGLWLGFTGALAASGVLLQFDLRPPPTVFVFVLTLGAGAALGLSQVGTRLAKTVPLYALVFAQSFRLPLELVMHEAAKEGTMPNAMSFSGYNFDIVPGASAVVVAFLLKRGAPLALAKAWNALGALLLTGVAVIAFLASPVVRAFGEDELNTWVGYLPFVWLPTILVTFAICGHIVVWKRCVMETQAMSKAPLKA
jgi:hypothetical protein